MSGAALEAVPAEGRPVEGMPVDDRPVLDLDAYLRHLEDDRERMVATVEQRPLAALTGWHASRDRDRIAHHAGGFFTVEGITVTLPGRSDTAWDQPIVVQDEVGVLGIIAKRFGGTLHLLMQHKVEPGNRNGVQVSPTVQATRSNFMRVHGGAATPYLDHFRSPERAGRQRVLVDVRQSEQGSWFFRKRNRNVVVEVFDDVEVLPGWYWLTLRQVAELMRHDDLVNMEVRSVLACLPAHLHLEGYGVDAGLDPTRTAPGTVELLSWISRVRSDHTQQVERCSLQALEDWTFDEDALRHRSGRYFTVIGVDVTSRSREVRRWDQPMVAAGANGVVALVVDWIDGEPHLLLQLRAEPGSMDGPELAPTVQCDPANYDADALPPYLAEVLAAPADRVLFDTMLSDEGGRFFHTSHRHLVVRGAAHEPPPGYRWLSLAQCSELARHSHYLNVQTRSLLACAVTVLGSMPAEGER